MAFGSSTLSDIGGAVSDLFAASGDNSKAQAMQLQAEGLQLKSQGDLLEKANYELASQYATENVGFTEQSTAIKQAQLDRSVYQTLGGEKAAVAGAGVTGGSSIYLLRDSASQGALTKAVAGTQGLITEAGYKEQAQSYTNMASAAQLASNEDLLSSQAMQVEAQSEKTAGIGSDITAGIKGIAAIATLF